MPWRECYAMDERLRCVARLLDGEKMAGLCREYDISRKSCRRDQHALEAQGWTASPVRVDHAASVLSRSSITLSCSIGCIRNLRAHTRARGEIMSQPGLKPFLRSWPPTN